MRNIFNKEDTFLHIIAHEYKIKVISYCNLKSESLKQMTVYWTVSTWMCLKCEGHLMCVLLYLWHFIDWCYYRYVNRLALKKKHCLTISQHFCKPLLLQSQLVWKIVSPLYFQYRFNGNRSLDCIYFLISGSRINTLVPLSMLDVSVHKY